MPELPEVETLARSLKKDLIGSVLTESIFLNAVCLKEMDREVFQAKIFGQQVEGIRRRGKYLIIMLTGYDLIFHLRMTGQLILTESSLPVAKHTHVIFKIKNANKELRYIDIRRFGCIWLKSKNSCEKEISGLKTLGVEPLGKDFTLAYLQRELQGRKTSIKSFLLNQNHIAGIGNIYADEILFAAKIHPEKRAAQLSETEKNDLYEAVKNVLEKGIEHRGTSISDYVDGRGIPGDHQNYLQVYQKDDHACQNCGAKIIKKKIAGRSSHYCPNCQKMETEVDE